MSYDCAGENDFTTQAECVPMKVFVACFVCSTVGFVAMGLSTGMFTASERPPADESTEEKKAETSKPKPARFPEDLAPAAKRRPVEKAAGFNTKSETNKFAFLNFKGEEHAWQAAAQGLNDDWLATTVEETAFVVLVGGQTKQQLEIQSYGGKAPPLRRFRWECEIYVIEAKTGKMVAQRTFVNSPRAIQPWEQWEITAIGRPVSERKVFDWLVRQAKTSFADRSTQPIVTVID